MATGSSAPAVGGAERLREERLLLPPPPPPPPPTTTTTTTSTSPGASSVYGALVSLPVLRLRLPASLLVHRRVPSSLASAACCPPNWRRRTLVCDSPIGPHVKGCDLIP